MHVLLVGLIQCASCLISTIIKFTQIHQRMTVLITAEVPLNYSAEFDEFWKIIVINKGGKIPINVTNELNLYFFTYKI